MLTDEEDSTAYKRNLKVNVKFFHRILDSRLAVVCITIERWFIHIVQVSHNNSSNAGKLHRFKLSLPEKFFKDINT